MTDCLCIFCHFSVQKLIGITVRIINCIIITCTDTASAAFALIVIDHCLLILICNGITSAFLCAAAASSAKVFIDSRFTAGMLFHFSCTASAAHSDILDGSAKSGSLMSLEVCKADKNIRIHNGTSDQGCLTVFSVCHRHLYLVCSAKSITDNDLAACCNCIKAIQICTVQMLQCIFSAARIQSIAVCQKGQSALLFAQICHCLCIVRTKESQISQLTKMHLDGYKLAFHINIPDSGCNTKLFQLVNLAGANRASKIRKINC